MIKLSLSWDEYKIIDILTNQYQFPQNKIEKVIDSFAFDTQQKAIIHFNEILSKMEKPLMIQEDVTTLLKMFEKILQDLIYDLRPLGKGVSDTLSKEVAQLQKTLYRYIEGELVKKQMEVYIEKFVTELENMLNYLYKPIEVKVKIVKD